MGVKASKIAIEWVELADKILISIDDEGVKLYLIIIFMDSQFGVFPSGTIGKPQIIQN